MKLYLLFFMLFIIGVGYAQDIPTNYQTKKIAVSDTIAFDNISINPLRFQVIGSNGVLIDSLDYSVDFKTLSVKNGTG